MTNVEIIFQTFIIIWRANEVMEVEKLVINKSTLQLTSKVIGKPQFYF